MSSKPAFHHLSSSARREWRDSPVTQALLEQMQASQALNTSAALSAATRGDIAAAANAAGAVEALALLRNDIFHDASEEAPVTQDTTFVDPADR